MIPAVDNLAPDRFIFWVPPAGAAVLAGADRQPVALPEFPLPLHNSVDNGGVPTDETIGQGVYDYLRQFPECPGNTVYAELLRDAYPHFVSDLASHAVLLDAKDVEPAFVARKLTCLKILCLLEPHNLGLLRQLCRGYFELALEFSELANCRRHLLDAMRFGQNLLAIEADDPLALSLLAEIDFLLGDTPAAAGKWRRLAARICDPLVRERIAARIAACSCDECPETALVDELEVVAEAMRLHASGDDALAAELLGRIEEVGQLTTTLPSADFFWLLGVCRQGAGDIGGALRALHQALQLESDHAGARVALDSL